jgi:hypothetical protein
VWADDHGYISVWNKPVNDTVKGFAAPVGGAGVAVSLRLVLNSCFVLNYGGV